MNTKTTNLLSQLRSKFLLLNCCLLLAAISLLHPASLLAKDDTAPTPGVFAPQTKPYGSSYSEWAAAWWQWVFSIPADQNPVVDQTGEFSAVGQSGPVFFLAGNFGGVTVRHCKVPPGKALIFPLLNVPWVQFPTDPPLAIEEIRAVLATLTDHPTLSCEIDGRPIPDLLNYREQSAVFSADFPEGNILGIEPGTYYPCLDDGYYLMLAPLKAGSHTIHFKATTADGLFSTEITYHLTVGL